MLLPGICCIIDMLMDIMYDLRDLFLLLDGGIRRLMHITPDNGHNRLQQEENSLTRFIGCFLPFRYQQLEQFVDLISFGRRFNDRQFLSAAADQQFIHDPVPVVLRGKMGYLGDICTGELDKSKSSGCSYFKAVVIRRVKQEQRFAGVRIFHAGQTMKAAALVNKDQFKMIMVM